MAKCDESNDFEVTKKLTKPTTKPDGIPKRMNEKMLSVV
jgi:hypothetical protein